MNVKQRKSAYFVPALEKGLDILEALSRVTVPQTLADLSRLCRRSRTEIFRMVDALERREYIVRDPVSGGYQLTLKIFQLAHTHSPIDQLLRASYFPMRDLANQLQESCHLCVMSGEFLLVIAEAESPSPVRLSVAVGHRVAPLTTASGRLLLAMLEEPARDTALRKDGNFQSMSPMQRNVLRKELIRARKTGFCLASSAYRTGLDVSCLVGSPGLGVTAALGIPFIAGGPNEGKESELVPAIRKYANRITHALGLNSKPTESLGAKGKSSSTMR